MSDQDNDLQNNTGVTDPDAGGRPQDQGADDEPITKEAFIALRQDLQNKIDELEDKNSLYKTQLHVFQSGGGNNAAPRPEDSDPFHGREDDDVVTVAEMRQIMSQMGASIGGTLGELRTASANTDYAEVVKTHLPNYLQKNPEMVAVLKALPPNLRPALAYKLGVQDPAYSAKKNKERLETDPSHDVRRIADNKRRPQPGGKGGGGPLAKAQLYESMSDEDFEKVLAKVKSGESGG